MYIRVRAEWALKGDFVGLIVGTKEINPNTFFSIYRIQAKFQILDRLMLN